MCVGRRAGRFLELGKALLKRSHAGGRRGRLVCDKVVPGERKRDGGEHAAKEACGKMSHDTPDS